MRSFRSAAVPLLAFLGFVLARFTTPATAQLQPATQVRNSNFGLHLATASPSPPARYTAATVGGTRLTTLRNVSATSIIVVGGKPIALRDLQAKIRTITLANLGPPLMQTRDGEIKGVFGSLGKSAFKGSSSLTKLAGTQTSVAEQGRSKITTFAAPVESIDDPTYCNSHAPYVTSVKGNVTPGGYVVVQGGCFAKSGKVALLGKFDGGALVLQTQNWDSGSITAAIPTVTGVYDQKVPLQITTAANAQNVSSVSVLDFVATRESLPLPGHFITATTCDQKYIQAQCVDGTGFRLELSNPFGGTDAWHVQAPTGWVLTSLGYSGAIGSVQYDGGFDQGGPNDASWSMTWKTGLARQEKQTETILGVTVSSDTYDFYGSTYGMTVYAVGPAGTMPS